jgi:hypothetical protein
MHEVQLDRGGEMQQPVLKSSWQGDDLILGIAETEHREGLPQDLPEPINQSATPITGAGKSIGHAPSAGPKSSVTTKKAPIKAVVH